MLFLAVLSIALTSCNDNGPVSADNDAMDRVTSSSHLNSVNLGHEAPEYSIPINPSHIGAENPGFEIGLCPVTPDGQDGWWGWHFVMPGTGDFTALSVTFENAGTFYADPFPGDVFVADPNNKHAYIWTPTPDVLTAATANATVNPQGGQFVLSHVCEGAAGESLDVNKTVDTYYIRTHDWSIDKWVDTDNNLELDDVAKIWLYTDGSGDENAEWTVEVTYEGYEDSGWKVSGTITIENIGTEAKVITNIVDELDGTSISIDCEDTYLSNGSYILPVGETMNCTYSEDGYVEGFNEVAVTVVGEDDPYIATEAIVWGDPDVEINAIVDVVDISDLFGSVDLGTLDAADFVDGESRTFDYNKDFEFADYGDDACGGFNYANIAEVRGDDDVVLDSADASLKVNVQCFVYESAWAKGDPNESFCDNGFNNWGWTNPMSEGSTQNMPLWAGAGQCDISKGTYVGYVEINYNSFDYTYHIEPGFNLTEYHIYAGETMFPQRRQGRNGWVNTVAPGQYYITPDLSGNIYVIAHGVVGLPDPNFGPTD